MAYTEQVIIAGGPIPASQSAGAVTAVAVEDVDQFEGQSPTELMAQILLELRIMNQQLYELPRLIASGLPSPDEPQNMRIDSTLFKL